MLLLRPLTPRSHFSLGLGICHKKRKSLKWVFELPFCKQKHRPLTQVMIRCHPIAFQRARDNTVKWSLSIVQMGMCVLHWQKSFRPTRSSSEGCPASYSNKRVHALNTDEFQWIQWSSSPRSQEGFLEKSWETKRAPDVPTLINLLHIPSL